MATNLLIPIHQIQIEGSPALHEALREVAARARPGESVLEVPADCKIWSVLFQVLYRAPVVGCHTSPSAVPWSSDLELYKESGALAALRCHPDRIGNFVRTGFTGDEQFNADDLSALQRDFGTRFFLIDRRALDRCERVAAALPLLERYETIGGDDRWLVIDVGSPPAPSPDPGS